MYMIYVFSKPFRLTFRSVWKGLSTKEFNFEKRKGLDLILDYRSLPLDSGFYFGQIALRPAATSSRCSIGIPIIISSSEILV